jgi:hypothetical protein
MSAAVQNRLRTARAAVGRGFFARALISSPRLVGLALLMAAVPLADETRAGETPNAELPETDCAAITNSALRTAIAEAEGRLDARWLKSGDGFITRYTIAGEEDNPLLPQADPKPATAAISGFAFARAFTCAVLESQDGSKVLFKFRADAVRFNEANAGWTQPTANGTVLVLLAAKQADAWSLQPGQGEGTIFPPGTELTRPDGADLPPHTTWPTTECRMPKLWSGSKCVRPKW